MDSANRHYLLTLHSKEPYVCPVLCVAGRGVGSQVSDLSGLCEVNEVESSDTLRTFVLIDPPREMVRIRLENGVLSLIDAQDKYDLKEVDSKGAQAILNNVESWRGTVALTSSLMGGGYDGSPSYFGGR